MTTIAFRVDSTARGKRLVDLGELMREAGYLEDFSFDRSTQEVRFRFAESPVTFGPDGEFDLSELEQYVRSETSIGKKFDDELLREVFNLDETGRVWQPEED
jgi:hypothetical protein